MTTKAVVTLVYGIIIAGGGIAGYVTVGSLASLISGGLLGLLAIIGAILMFMGNSLGFKLAAIATVLVALFFGYKLIQAMGVEGGNLGRPAGILVLSVIELMVLFLVPANTV